MTTVTYPLPLRPDFVAELRLPEDLTMVEVERIYAYLKTLIPEPWYLAHDFPSEKKA